MRRPSDRASAGRALNAGDVLRKPAQVRQPMFHVFQDKRGGWVWHLKAANGRIIAQGESHTRKRDAERAVSTVVETASWAMREGGPA